MRRSVLVAFTIALACAGAGLGAQGDANAAARRRYEQGRRLLVDGNYKEALTDLDETIRIFPTSPWAGRAIALEVEYFLEVERDFERARKDLERLKAYSPDVAPAAYLFSGRITLASSRSRESIASAALDFQRAEQYYPGSPFVPEARYRAGEAFRLNRQIDEAIDRFQNVVLAYPRSIWSARAGLRLAQCLVARDRWQEAIGALQRLRVEFRSVPEAAAELQDALTLNTILFRLYVRPSGNLPSFRYAGKPFGSRLEDVSAMAFMPSDLLVVAEKTGLVRIDASGEMLPRVMADEPTAVARRRSIDSLELASRTEVRPVFATRRGLVLDNGPGGVVPLRVKEAAEKIRVIDRTAAVLQQWNRDWLVADSDSKTLFVFGDKGEFRRPFTPGVRELVADRLVSTTFDDIVALDSDKKRVTWLDRDGRMLSQVDAAGPDYRFERPVDLAVDAFGHVYVLDRGKGQVFVFAPVVGGRPKLVTTLTSATEKDPSAFRKPAALGLDSRGRLFIYDENTRRIQVFQ